MDDFEKYWEENASKESWANKAVAWNIWKEKQAIINDLRAQLNNMEACYIEKKKQVKAVSHMLEEDLKYVEQDRRGNFDFLQMAMIRCLGDAIKTLRGAND